MGTNPESTTHAQGFPAPTRGADAASPWAASNLVASVCSPPPSQTYDQDETDDGVLDELGEQESGPTRRCIVTQESRSPFDMIRFVVGPNDTVFPDLDGSLPGRGMWVSADAGILQQAIEKKRFSRAARKMVVVPQDLVNRIETLLTQRCIDGLGLARRAGRAIGGFEKVTSHLRSARDRKAPFTPGLLLTASDASEGTEEKMRGLRDVSDSSLRGKAGLLPRLTVLTAQELGRAFGRDHFVHVLIGDGPLAERLLKDGHRLSGMRSNPHGRPQKQSGPIELSGGAQGTHDRGSKRHGPEKGKAEPS